MSIERWYIENLYCTFFWDRNISLPPLEMLQCRHKCRNFTWTLIHFSHVLFFFQILLSHFDAFKFPSSEVVQFRALVTPCMPSCEPVQCDQEESTGELRSVISYGKRRRRRSTSSADIRDDLLLVQSIQITDKFGFEGKKNVSNKQNEVFIREQEGELLFGAVNGSCVNLSGVIVAGTVFLAAQLAVIAAWTFVWQRRRASQYSSKYAADAMSVSVSMPASSVSRTDSLCKLYDAGYGRRF